MKIKYCLAFLMLVILAIALMGAAATFSLRASGLSFNSGVKKLEFQNIEEDVCFDPTYGEDNGFVVNPYLAGNPDRNQALIIGASVSYILKEVKAFTMFAVALAVVTLIAYVTIAYIVLNRIVKPIVKAEEPGKNEELGMRNEEYGNDNNDSKEPGGVIENRNSGAALLSRNIDEMLSEIDTVLEKGKVKWSVLL
jgi:hypothetical protein